MDNTLLQALALIPALVIAIVFHEVAHGWVALLLGDPTAKERKRLSLNPIRHVDPFGTLIVPGLLMLGGLPAFGWAKPVPVIKRAAAQPRFGMMAVAAAGPGTNLVLAAIGAVIWGLFVIGRAEPSGVIGQVAIASLQSFILINVFLALFNLLPIPPFDGSHIVEGLLPNRPRASMRSCGLTASSCCFFSCWWCRGCSPICGSWTAWSARPPNGRSGSTSNSPTGWRVYNFIRVY